MARNSSAITRAFLASLIFHVAALAIPSLTRNGQIASTATPIEVRLGAPTLMAEDRGEEEQNLPPEEIANLASSSVSEAANSANQMEGLLPLGVSTTETAPTPVPVYFTAGELHQRPIPLRTIDLAEIQRHFPNISGTFSILIDDRGNVDKVQLLDSASSGPVEVFVAFLQEIRFVPGKIAGQAVRCELRINIAKLMTTAHPPPSSGIQAGDNNRDER